MADESSTKRTYPVRLLGRNLAIQTAAGREEVDTVAGFVARRLEEARLASRSTDVAEVAILAALNLASDLLRLQATLDDERNQLHKWAAEVCTRIDARSATTAADQNSATERCGNSLE